MSTSLPRSWIAFFIYALPLFISLAAAANGGNFTIVNGQIFTPGLAIIDAPQPNTPEGGDFLQIAIDISGDGQLKMPPNNVDNLTQIFNITLFLTSYEKNHNFTISNSTGPAPPLLDILRQETSGTVKHVNWLWPLCLVGDGQPKNASSDRGNYNISIHQNFRMNGSNFYTIMDLPIQVTNSIPQDPSPGAAGNNPRPGPMNGFNGRVSCGSIENGLTPDDVRQRSVNMPLVQPFIGGPIQIQKPADKSSAKTGNAQRGVPVASRFLVFLAPLSCVAAALLFA